MFVASHSSIKIHLFQGRFTFAFYLGPRVVAFSFLLFFSNLMGPKGKEIQELFPKSFDSFSLDFLQQRRKSTRKSFFHFELLKL